MTPDPAPARVLVLTAAYNEAGKIGPALTGIPRDVVERVVCIDDGSTDGSGAEAEAAGAVVLRNDAQCGVGSAIRRGVAYARAEGFDVLVLLAGNGKDDTREIPRLVAPLLRDEADLVQGSRYLPGGVAGGAMPLYRRLATQYVHPLLFSLAARRRIHDSTNGFRACRLTLFDDPRMDLSQPWLQQYELEPYILFKAIRLGYRVMEVPVTKIYPSKAVGYTKMKPFSGWWSILRPIFLLGLGLRK